MGNYRVEGDTTVGAAVDGGHDSGTTGGAALERTALSQCFEREPQAAGALVAHVRRRRERGLHGHEVPGRPVDAAWAAEGGWKSDPV